MTRRTGSLASRRTGAAIVAAALIVCGGAHAQSSSPSKGGQASPPAPPAGNSAQAQTAAPAGGAPLPWSGEDGASGHPLMTASAIREAAANFDNCVAAMWPDAARRGISQASFERFTAGLAPDLRLMDLMDSQPEFTTSW